MSETLLRMIVGNIIPLMRDDVPVVSPLRGTLRESPAPTVKGLPSEPREGDGLITEPLVFPSIPST